MHLGIKQWSLYCTLYNILNTRDGVSSAYPDTEKGFENTTHSGVSVYSEFRGV